MNFKIITLTVALIVITSVSTFAQDGMTERAKQWMQEKVVDRIHNFDKSMNLTEEQMQKIIEAKISDIKKIQEINKSNMSTEEKQIAAQNIFKGIYPMLKEILTPEQLKAWAEGGNM